MLHACRNARQTQSPEVWNPVLLATYPTAALASIAVSAATLKLGFQQAGVAGPAAAWSALIGSGLAKPKSAAGWVYSVFLLLYAATGEAGQARWLHVCAATAHACIQCCCLCNPAAACASCRLVDARAACTTCACSRRVLRARGHIYWRASGAGGAAAEAPVGAGVFAVRRRVLGAGQRGRPGAAGREHVQATQPGPCMRRGWLRGSDCHVHCAGAGGGRQQQLVKRGWQCGHQRVRAVAVRGGEEMMLCYCAELSAGRATSSRVAVNTGMRQSCRADMPGCQARRLMRPYYTRPPKHGRKRSGSSTSQQHSLLPLPLPSLPRARPVASAAQHTRCCRAQPQSQPHAPTSWPLPCSIISPAPP